MGKSIITLSGDRELQQLFAELPERVIKKGLRQAISAGASPMVKAARAGASKESGLLKRSMAKKIKTYPSGNVVAIIGSNVETQGVFQGRRRVPKNYIALVEQGTRPHSLNKGAALARKGKSAATARGQQGGQGHPGSKGTHFLHDAYESTKDRSVAIAGAKLKEVVEAEAMKLGKR